MFSNNCHIPCWFCCCSKLVKQPKAHCYDIIEYFPWYFLVYKVWQCCLSTMFAEIARSSYFIASSRVIGRHLLRPIFATSARTVATINSQIKLKSISTTKPVMYSTVEKGNKNSHTYSLYFSKYEKKAATAGSLSFGLIKLTCSCNRHKQLCNKLRPIKRRLLYQQYKHPLLLPLSPSPPPLPAT